MTEVEMVVLIAELRVEVDRLTAENVRLAALAEHGMSAGFVRASLMVKADRTPGQAHMLGQVTDA